MKDAVVSSSSRSLSDWEQVLYDRLPLYGHRNWIVVADSAYPAQAQNGIQTIVADAEQSVVLEKVFAALCASRHIKPVVYTDRELRFVSELDAPGITAYRNQLEILLEDFGVSVLPHEEIITKLERAARIFRVMIIKTNTTIPYTSVFFELDCAYWNRGAEDRLRSAMGSENKHAGEYTFRKMNDA